MNKVSDVLAERFSQDPLDKLPLYDFAMTFWKQKLCKPIASSKVSNENINFESNRTSSMSGNIQTKQSLLSPRVSSSHQIPNCHKKSVKWIHK